MNNKKLLIFTLAIGLLSSHCLEGMDRKDLPPLSHIFSDPKEFLREYLHYFFYRSCTCPIKEAKLSSLPLLNMPVSNVPDDCILEILRFLDKEKTFLNFGLTSKGNRELVNKFWTNKSYCGNRGVKIKYNKKTKESFLKFCKEHPDWPYSIWFAEDSTASDVNVVLGLCTNVKELNLSWCEQITEWDNIQWSKIAKNLEELKLEKTKITADGLNKIFEVCKNIKNLNLWKCRIIWREMRWNKLASLEVLNLGWTTVSGTDLDKMLKNCRKIRQLDLPGYFDCNGVASGGWMDRLPALEELNVGNTYILSREINKILNVCPKLRRLNLFSCKGINWWGNTREFGRGVCYASLARLEELNLGCANVGINEINKILKVCTKLKKLNLSWCKQITKEEVEKLENEYKNCKIIFFK